MQITGAEIIYEGFGTSRTGRIMTSTSSITNRYARTLDHFQFSGRVTSPGRTGFKPT
jgi:hypothetical protein